MVVTLVLNFMLNYLPSIFIAYGVTIAKIFYFFQLQAKDQQGNIYIYFFNKKFVTFVKKKIKKIYFEPKKT